MPPADNMPDFESMSPEELQAWMETLAERQGATEGFTTEQRVEIDEIDPDSVEVEDRYIPYGKTPEEWARIQEEERAARAARQAQQSSAAVPPEQAQAQPAAPPPEEATPAAAAAIPAAAPDNALPDFDSMSPEEIQAWMETLAERQGATEGFVTEQRMEIGEIDPGSVQVEDRYIPYGKTPEEWAQIQEQERAERAERRAQQPAAPAPQPEPEPEAEQPAFELPELEEPEVDQSTEVATAESGGLDWLSDLAADESAAGAEFPQMDLSGLSEELDLENLGAGLENLEDNLDLEALDLGGLADQDTDPMEWLDGLVRGEGEAFDLQTEEPATEQQPPQPEPRAAEPASDPMEWLESLARRQGASEDEFFTEAAVDLPDLEEEAPEQVDTFSFEEETADATTPGFDTVDALDQAPLDASDPSAWLDSLASSQHTTASRKEEKPGPELFDGDMEAEEDEAVSTDRVISELNRGISDPSMMRSWMDNLLEQGAARTDIPDYLEEDEDQPLEANIPDWLIDQVGNAPPEITGEIPGSAVEEDIITDLGLEEEAGEPHEAEAMPDWLSEQLEESEADTIEAELSLGDAGALGEIGADIPDWMQEEIVDEDGGEAEIPDWLRNQMDIEVEAEAVPEIPDWLKEDVEEAEEEEPVSAIFRTAEEDTSDIDVNDSWVEAFEMERQMQIQGLEEPPQEWLEQGLRTDHIAAEVGILEDTTLEPETELMPGEPEPVPEWLDSEAEPLETREELVAAELPDWLREQQDEYETGETASAEAVPDWLSGAGVTDAEDVPNWLMDTITEEAPVVSEQPEPARPEAPPQRAISPAPPPPFSIDADDTLEKARTAVKSGELEEGLQGYEMIIRANERLDAVVEDLTTLLQSPAYKDYASIYRVLGDVLMRQGKLQQALDTYRRALNLL